ncbi:MAG TPA: polyphosphate kinase 1 [Planctomycetota bacterium]|nr:polyphosphate kinase 1 [Planctomycetota bacterium]
MMRESDLQAALGEQPRAKRASKAQPRDAAPGSVAPAEAVLPAPEAPPAAPAETPPADLRPPPQPDASGAFDLAQPGHYLNRELTWLNFNFRVLHEAEDPRTPLLERVKFIAIVSGNIDEFFQKRIGGLKQQIGAGLLRPSVDGRTPLEQLTECMRVVRMLEERKRALLPQIFEELGRHGLAPLRYAELTDEERAYLREEYQRNIFPLVTPQGTDPAHPFPFISNLSLNLLVTLRYPQDQETLLARVKVPVGGGIPRFLKLPNRGAFVRIESVMAHNLDLLFPGMEVEGFALFRVTRNANTERDEERAEDLLAMIESELRDRKLAPVVRLEVATTMAPHHRAMLAAELGLDERNDVLEVDGVLGLRDLWEIARLPVPELHDPPHYPADHPDLVPDRNIFHIIRDAGSILLHHPYQSFANSVERFLLEASRDPKVRAIKMTLYRTSSESKAVEYLIDAARNGKQVAVVVELKARFDEEANIRWANRMEEAGIHVTYGVVGLKTHCKVILVVRQDFNGLRRYAHIGTGNYHAGTARLYTDLGLLTCDPAIGQDVTELFNYLTTGYKPRRNYQEILVSPKTCKPGLLRRIRREAEWRSKGQDAAIQIRANALEDPDVTRELYLASQAGVKIDLILRDSCRLRPGVPGLSDNVRVQSIVGRFLEHGRVYYFRNGGDEEYFIGSADPMQRNLESRVEVLAPVKDPALRKDLRVLLDTQLADCRAAWDMRPDGSYVQRDARDPAARSSQQALVEWAEKRMKEATRLRKRKPEGIQRRNVR